MRPTLAYRIRRPRDGYTLPQQFVNPVEAFRFRASFPDRWDWTIVEVVRTDYGRD